MACAIPGVPSMSQIQPPAQAPTMATPAGQLTLPMGRRSERACQKEPLECIHPVERPWARTLTGQGVSEIPSSTSTPRLRADGSGVEGARRREKTARIRRSEAGEIRRPKPDRIRLRTIIGIFREPVARSHEEPDRSENIASEGNNCNPYRGMTH